MPGPFLEMQTFTVRGLSWSISKRYGIAMRQGAVSKRVVPIKLQLSIIVEAVDEFPQCTEIILLEVNHQPLEVGDFRFIFLFGEGF